MSAPAPTLEQMAEACECQADWMMTQPGALTMVDDAVALRAAAATLRGLKNGEVPDEVEEAVHGPCWANFDGG